MAGSREYYWRQFRAIFLKNWALRKREKATNCCQITTPIFLILILFGLQASLNSSLETDLKEDLRPNITAPFLILGRPDYDEIETPEFYLKNSSIIYTDTSDFFEISESSAVFTTRYLFDNDIEDIGAPYSDDFDDGGGAQADVTNNIILMDSSSDLKSTLYDAFDYAYETPYSSAFEISSNNKQFELLMYTNFSISWYTDLPFVWTFISSPLSNALSNGQKTIVLLGNKFFPQEEDTIPFDITSLAGTFFYMLILHQLLPIFMSTLVYEKEYKLREVMKMMGMNMTMYWVVNYIYFYVLYLFLVFFLCAFGFLAGFRFFTINAPATYWILFIIWGHTLISMAYLGSALMNHSKTATLIGYFFMVAVALLAEYLINSDVSDLDTSKGLLFAISLFPSFALYRGLIYLSIEVSFEGPGIDMSTVDASNLNLAAVYGHLIVEWIVFLFLAWYLEQVVPSTFGVKKPYNFLFTKSYWTGESSYVHSSEDIEMQNAKGEDVMKEYQTTMEDTSNDLAVRMKHLRKVFPLDDVDNEEGIIQSIISFFRGGREGGNENVEENKKKSEKVAVKDLTMSIRKGECLGFLGHNGAGKTTTINMLCGLYAPTSGTAEIFNHDLKTNMEEVYQIMGVCPQHDVLWETMNAKDHLLFYGRLKGLRGQQLRDAADDVLKSVNLYDVRNKLAGKYSGGMKRRLSVAIALIGKPKLVFLDEPSTGLDPASKRTLWEVISKAKEHASMLLTTHSMEEADALCDRLAIFSGGELRTIGYSSDLKSRYGVGFKVSVSVKNEGENVKRLPEFMRELCPGAILQSEMLGHFTYEVPTEELSLSIFFRSINENKHQLGIVDWGIGNTTLEEVFIHVVESTWEEAIHAKELSRQQQEELPSTNNVLYAENNE